MNHDKKIWNDLAKSIHTDNKTVGWWDNPDECVMQKLQLVSTEISEATEGARKSLMDTHLHWRVMEEVEYADALIRILDIGGKLGFLFEDPTPHPWCLVTNSIGHQHLGINAAIIDFADAYSEYTLNANNDVYKFIARFSYSDLISSVVKVAENRGFQVFEPIAEKRRYNANRADHKRENRATQNGKKF